MHVASGGGLPCADAAPHAVTPAPMPVDKWNLLDRLTLARHRFGVSHKELGVLRALLSFLPGRDIDAGPGAGAIVFPSNATLAARLNGMPESTLRRHLARLVQAGLVSRRDSPNCKRYIRRDRHGSPAHVFGFDLAPLACAAGAIDQAADAAEAERDALVLTRERVSLRLKALEQSGAARDLVDTARARPLRRLDLDALETLERALIAAAKQLGSAAPGAGDDTADKAATDRELSASSSRIERHHQRSEKDTSDLDPRPVDNATHVPAVARRRRAEPSGTQDLPARLVHAACPEARSYLPDTGPTWPSLIQASERLAPMMGIGRDVLQGAEDAMGRQGAAATIMWMLERIADIRNPGGYLRRLASRASEGQYDAARLFGRAGPEIVS